MHCADPGCLAACPADGAIVQVRQRHRGFSTRTTASAASSASPDVPSTFRSSIPRPRKFTSARSVPTASAQGLEPACIKACPTGCLHFGTKDDMKFIAEKRATQLRDNFGLEKAGVYDPQAVGGTHVIYVLHDATDPEAMAVCPRIRKSPGAIPCGSGCLNPCWGHSPCLAW